jgi:beta-lactamase regulating signal transducer with metallopeptidase domain
MIFHWVLNSFLVFIVLTMLIEFALYAFNISNARVRYLCRSLPIIKLPLDLLIFALFDENIFLNFNPFSCEMYLQNFILDLVPLPLKADLAPNEQLIIPLYIAGFIPASILKFIVVSVTVVAIVLLTRKLFMFLSYRNYLKKLLKSSLVCERFITNAKLKSNLERLNVLLFVSQDVYVPIAANRKYIFMPAVLMEEFSQDEFESVIAHELEHLSWRDPYLKLVNSVISALFWWIPTQWWMKRLESDQEQASDFSVHKYGMDPYALGTALMKTVAKAKYLNYEIAAICSLDSAKGTHVQRFEKLLASRSVQSNKLSLKSALGVAFCCLAFISFWMC